MGSLLTSIGAAAAAGIVGVASPAPPVAPAAAPADKPWYDRLSIRGYGQFRDSQTLAGDPGFVTEGDRFVGPTATLGFRRIRLVLSGDVSDRVAVYFQPDFATVPPNSEGTLNYGQLRDLYADVALDARKESRLRVGQSKIPFGFENLQSSGQRLMLDRSDALNSGVREERDMGVFYYWAPAEIRARFDELVDSGLKGSGDFGVLGLGAYAGQGANRADANNELHVVGRLTWPHKLPNGQFVEASVQGYRGRFAVRTSEADAAAGRPAVTSDDPLGLTDERLAATFVWYPQPFGLQAEWTVGRGPQLDPATARVGVAPLSGGYVQAIGRFEAPGGLYYPFVRWQTYEGARKAERDAPGTSVAEVEAGVEWHPWKELEVTLQYARSRRNNVQSAPYAPQQADLLRTQVQWNF